MPLIDRDCCAAYKVLVLGEASVGKSALVNCLMGREFRESMVPTIGVDFVKKIFEVDGALIQLVIWDTAGQQRFRSITRLQYRGVQEMKHAHNQYEPIPIVLCGNKADLDHKRQVKKVKAFELAQKEMAFEFFETSAKTGSNVFTAFQRLAFHITDICNPKLMVSYHPYLVRRIEDSDSELLKIKANIDQKKKDKKSKKKPKNNSKKQLVPLAKTNRVQCSPFNGLCCLLPQKQELT